MLLTALGVFSTAMAAITFLLVATLPGAWTSWRTMMLSLCTVSIVLGVYTLFAERARSRR